MFDREAYCQRYFLRKEAGVLSAAAELGGKAIRGVGNFITNRVGGFLNNHVNAQWVTNAGNKVSGWGNQLINKSQSMLQNAGKAEGAVANTAGNAAQAAGKAEGAVANTAGNAANTTGNAAQAAAANTNGAVANAANNVNGAAVKPANNAVQTASNDMYSFGGLTPPPNRS